MLSKPFLEFFNKWCKFFRRDWRRTHRKTAGIYLDGGFSDEAEITIEVNVFVKDLEVEALCAKSDDARNSTTDFVVITGL